MFPSYLRDDCKYLGVIFDSKLNFKPYLHLIETIAKGVGILSRLRSTFPASTPLMLYFSLIYPHLLFGLTIWGNTFPTYLAKLQRLKALRIIPIRNSDPP